MHGRQVLTNKINVMETDRIIVRTATAADLKYAMEISAETASSAKARGTGIGSRTPQSICNKILDGNAVIALTQRGEWVGYIYLEAYAEEEFISHCGLIVSPFWRRKGIATLMKRQIFELSKLKYPKAKIFGITTSLATMKINSKLGLYPVSFSEITQDPSFWNKCQNCINYPDLKKKEFKNCYCTAMLFDPSTVQNLNIEKNRRSYSSPTIH
jgi:hypothetical protein